MVLSAFFNSFKLWPQSHILLVGPKVNHLKNNINTLLVRRPGVSWQEWGHVPGVSVTVGSVWQEEPSNVPGGRVG